MSAAFGKVSQKLLGRSLHKSVGEYFQYKSAIVGSVTESFVARSIRREEPAEPIDLENARRQHDAYVEQLKKVLNGPVVQVPLDERYPDSVFVEDPVFVLDGVALLTQMSSPSRAGEKHLMRQTLEQYGDQLGITDIREMTMPGAYLDGGDILFTGREILIGLSSRSNKAGIEELSKVFPTWPVRAITVNSNILHLKSLACVCGIDAISISDTAAGKQAWKEITANTTYKYNAVVLPEDCATNCIYMNGVLIHPTKDDFPNSYHVWESMECSRVAVSTSELSKADGLLTCCSVRI